MYVDFFRLSDRDKASLRKAIDSSGGDPAVRAWATGTTTGGPLGDGTYPIALSNGSVIMVPCPAKFALSSNATTNIMFNTAIPLDGSYVMAARAITGATVFTPQATRKPGSSCYVRLIADGVNLPTFSGMAEHGSSSGWNGTVGYVNLVTFWFDGVQVLYSISQTVSGSVAAVISGSMVSYQTPTTMTLSFTSPISNAAVPAISAFTLTNSGGVDTITNVAVIGGAVVLTKSRSTQANDTMTVSYNAPTTNALTDNNGNTVSSFVNGSVTYQPAPPPASFIRLENLTGITESGDATSGYTYTGVSVGPNFAGPRAVGGSAKVLPANQDGFLSVTVDGVYDHGVILALTDRSNPSGYPDFYLGIYQDQSYSGYQPFYNYGNYGSSSAVAAAGDVVRLRRQGTTGYFEVSKDNGATFSTSASVNNISTGALHPAIQIGALNAKCVKLSGSSNIA